MYIKMTSIPCYEVLGMVPSSEHTSEAIDLAYLRVKEILGADISASDDIESAYETLRSLQKRNTYILNLVPYKVSEWSWMTHEDSEGVWRSLVRCKQSKDTWTQSDNKDRRNNKKNKMNDRKGERDKRRGPGGYD